MTAPHGDGRPPLIVSGCLVGLRTRLDGGHHEDACVLALGDRFTLVPVCPEQLGGLPTPRPPAEIQSARAPDGSARVLTRDGVDVSEEFQRGAAATLAVAAVTGARAAVLKARSPSCGVGEVYDGSFTGALTVGSGIASHALGRAGLELYTEEDVAAGLGPTSQEPGGRRPRHVKESD